MKEFLFVGLALVVTLPSSAKDHPALSMKVFTSPDDQFWVNSTILGAGATSGVVAISKYDADFIEFENSRIEILRKLQGDTDENTMLWFPEQRTLIAGDTVFNDMHVYTAETDSNARKNWSSTLKKIRKLKPSVVIPGHSKVGAPLDATTALDFTERYLLVFEEELKKAKDPESLVKTMKDDFPSADLILALERGAKANVKH
jgi:glyoxylase-like metal-dependent hydrolase (beta-lactamase superfamily II)